MCGHKSTLLRVYEPTDKSLIQNENEFYEQIETTPLIIKKPLKITLILRDAKTGKRQNMFTH